MESVPLTVEESCFFKKEINLISDKKEEIKIIFESQTNSSILITAINHKKIRNNFFSASVSLEKFRENKYFYQFDTIKELCDELNERIRTDNLKLLNHDNSLTLTMLLPSTKYKEISFDLKEKEKSDKEKINELYSIIEDYHKENEILKKEIEEIKKYIYEQKKEKEQEKNSPIINFNSLIVKDIKKINTLKSWIVPKGNKIKAELLYRLSKDGESIATFHQLCDNKGPTITLFETLNGTAIGFYSPLDFDSNYGNFKQDMNTFIFNLDNQIKFGKIENDGSIYCKNTFGPYVAYFGMYDGEVKNMKKCYYNPNCTKNKFKNGNNIIPNNNQNVTFDLKEVEIWKINIE